MIHKGAVFRGMLAGSVGLLFLGAIRAAPENLAPSDSARTSASMQKRWLFVWRDMSDPREVDRMIARFPQAQAAGYNGVVFSYNIAREKAAELRHAAVPTGPHRHRHGRGP
jgi:hypothetical protein